MLFLPSRYEDLKLEFRERLKPVPELLRLVSAAYTSISTNGGIRFLPIFGESGSGKSSAALEIARHMPNCRVSMVPPELIADRSQLEDYVMLNQRGLNTSHLLILVIDQYEERVASRSQIPSQFVEHLSLLDRGSLRHIPTLFLWLTTSVDFQRDLIGATTRNRRIVVRKDFKLEGPTRTQWPDIIEETFQFHNTNQPLADYEVLTEDLFTASIECETIGAAIESIGSKVGQYNQQQMDLSEYMVAMLWPVTNSYRTALISTFSDIRNGYRLDWNAWFRSLNHDDKLRYPLHQLNRARLYFDFRLIPIPVASIYNLCKYLENDRTEFGKSHLLTFIQTHFYSIVSGSWKPERYTPIQIGDSDRANEAETWYKTVTTSPTQLGKRLAKVLQSCGQNAKYEYNVKSPYQSIRSDLYVEAAKNILVELKVYAPGNTTISRINAAIGTTLKKYAQFAGFYNNK